MYAILENIVSPLVRRIGTAAAIYLLSLGADSALVEQAVNAVSAVVLIGVDLLLARVYRKSVVSKTAALLGFGGFRPITPEGVKRFKASWPEGE